MSATAILGIGNNLLQDDGAGIHVLQHFERSNRGDEVTCIDAGTVGLAIMDRLFNLDGLIAIDAMRLGKPPGTVTVLEGADMDDCLRNHRGSAHEVGLSDLMDALRLSDALPEHRALIGIEPESVGWGTEPTPGVAAAVPHAAKAAQRLLSNWRSGNRS